MHLFCQEPSNGNIEYKQYLKILTRDKFERYSTQLKYRIIEGNGKAIYIVGITDSGSVYGIPQDNLEKTIHIVSLLTNYINSYISYILKCTYNKNKFLIFNIKSKFNIDNLSVICK